MLIFRELAETQVATLDSTQSQLISYCSTIKCHYFYLLNFFRFIAITFWLLGKFWAGSSQRSSGPYTVFVNNQGCC